MSPRVRSWKENWEARQSDQPQEAIGRQAEVLEVAGQKLREEVLDHEDSHERRREEPKRLGRDVASLRPEHELRFRTKLTIIAIALDGYLATQTRESGILKTIVKRDEEDVVDERVDHADQAKARDLAEWSDSCERSRFRHSRRHEPDLSIEGPWGTIGRVAVTSPPKLDARKLRADFPIFEQEFHGKPLAYLDSAATAQKPRQVLDALRTFYETSYANVHRGVYELSERATAGYEGAREKLATFVNAPSAKELIFTRNATEGLNLVAYAWGLVNLGPGDVVARDRARAPLELRALAVRREEDRRRLPDDPARRPGRARPQRPGRRGR